MSGIVRQLLEYIYPYLKMCSMSWNVKYTLLIITNTLVWSFKMVLLRRCMWLCSHNKTTHCSSLESECHTSLSLPPLWLGELKWKVTKAVFYNMSATPCGLLKGELSVALLYSSQSIMCDWACPLCGCSAD